MKRTLVAVAVAATTLVAWRWHASTTTTTKDGGNAKLVLDRLWIDHVPKDDKDPVKVFVALTQDPVGIFQTTTAWKGEYEVFQYERAGGEIHARYPQTGDHEKFTFVGSKCHDDKMDYCLELAGSSRGAKHYFSMKGWELDGVPDAHAIEAMITR